MALAEAEWEEEKLKLTTAHEIALKAAEDHNEKIKPIVETAKAAAQELQRVVAFLAVVRACAAKASLGVNYVPGAPNLDRVVEMATLTSALEAAYPELSDPAMDSPLAQSEVIPWPTEAWTTRAPHGTSCAASVRKTRATLAQIQAIECGYRICTEDPAVNGRKRPKSAVCRSSSMEQRSVARNLADAAVVSDNLQGIEESSHVLEHTKSSGFNKRIEGFNETMGYQKGTDSNLDSNLEKRPELDHANHKTCSCS